MTPRKATNKIIIHCSATRPSQDKVDVKEIRRWHVDERGWSDIGYHFVIKRDGTLEKGRSENLVGAHTVGENHDSIGICLVGGIEQNSMEPEENFTENQFKTLHDLLAKLKVKYGNKIRIFGHNDFDKKKACPSFSVADYLAQGKF